MEASKFLPILKRRLLNGLEFRINTGIEKRGKNRKKKELSKSRKPLLFFWWT
jgi:hypothetical protein